MFQNQSFYQQENIGSIKFSRSDGQFDFKNRTSGLAIKYAVRGRELYRLGGQSYVLNQGQFIIFDAHIDYRVGNMSENPSDGFCIDIAPNALSNKNSAYEHCLNTVYHCGRSTSLGKYLRNLTLDHTEVQGERLIKDLSANLSQFIRQIDDHHTAIRSTVRKTTTRKQLTSRLLFARDLIHSHYRSKLTLQQLAKKTGISKSHLSRLFTRCFGQSPQALQEELRMAEAKALLANKQWPITDIAIYLGYTDLAAFSNRFKQVWQQSPSSYAKK